MTASTRQPERPELLTAEQVGQLLGWKSRFNVDQLDRDESMPVSVELANSGKRWRRTELMDWIAAGMPHRSIWRWKPTVAENLDQLIRRQHKELADLGNRVSQRRAELEGLLAS